jgi:hypothetical protein
MRNMSFMLTTDQIRSKTKTVTRRDGWWFLKPGDIIQAVEKCQGLKKGQKISKLCQIRIISTHSEPISSITKKECELEGFPEMQPDEFIDMFCKSHKHVTLYTIVNRIEFEYL